LATIHEDQGLLKEVKSLLKNPADLTKTIQELLDSNRALQQKIEVANKASAKDLKGDLQGKIEEVNGIKFLAQKVDLDTKSLKDIVFQLKSEVAGLLIVLANEAEGKVGMTVALSDDLISEKKMDAGDIIRKISKAIHGGGGGQPFYATAGGRNPDGIPEAFEKAKAIVS